MAQEPASLHLLNFHYLLFQQTGINIQQISLLALSDCGVLIINKLKIHVLGSFLI